MAVLSTSVLYLNTSNRPHEARSRQASPAQRKDCGCLESADEVRYRKCRFCADLLHTSSHCRRKKTHVYYTLLGVFFHIKLLCVYTSTSRLLVRRGETQALLWSQATVRETETVHRKNRKEIKTLQTPCQRNGQEKTHHTQASKPDALQETK